MADEAVRASLTARVSAIAARLDRAQPQALARELDELRSIAHSNGLDAAAAVAPLIALAIVSGGQRGVARSWLGILDDAIASDRHDPEAALAFRGACSIRLAAG